MKSALCFLLISTSSIAFSKSSHVLKFYKIPLEKFSSCKAFADETLAPLSNIEGLDIKNTLCERRSSTEHVTLIVKIETDITIQISSTHRLDNIYPDRGVYKSYERCLKNLSSEKSRFDAESGLESIVSYCSFEKYERTWQWYANISSITGAPKKVYMRSDWRSSKVYVSDMNSFVENIQNTLKLKNKELVHMRIRPLNSFGKATIHYYDDVDSTGFATKSEVIVDRVSRKRCSDLEAKLYAISQSFDDSLSFLTGYCQSQYADPNSYELNLVTINKSPRIDYSAESFESLSQCQSAKPSIENAHRDFHGDDLFGSVCGREPYESSHIFRVALLKKPY